MAAIDIGELRGILSLDDKFSGPMNDAAKGIGVFSESFGACTKAAGLAAAAVTSMGAAILALGSRGSEVADVSGAFAGLSKAAGSSADVMLGALRAGTMGTISDFDLMQTGVKALGGGMISSARDMETLASGARGLAKDTGTTTADAFATLTKAMATGRTAGLANAGLMVDTKAATLAYANSLGVSVGELTKHEKAVAASQAILAALNQRFKDKAPADFKELMEQANVTLGNFKDKLAVAIAQSPVMTYALTTIGNALKDAFGNESKDQIATLMKGVNQFAIALTYVAEYALVAANVFVTAWYAVKTMILAVETVIVGLGTGIVQLVSGLASMGAAIPGVGKYVAGFAEGAKELAANLTDVTEGLRVQTVEAAKGVAGNNAATAQLGKMSAAVLDARARMEELAKVQIVVAEAARKFGAATVDASVVADSSARKIAEAFQRLEGELDLVGRVGLDRELVMLKTKAAAEILHLADLKDITVKQTEAMTAIIMQRYNAEVVAAKASGDEIKKATTKIENELALMKVTGLKKTLLALDQQRDLDIENVAKYAQRYTASYDRMVSDIKAKYEILKTAATGFHDTAAQAAEASGIKTRAQMQAITDNTLNDYNLMRASGEFTATALTEAWKRYTDAHAQLSGKRVMLWKEELEVIASSAATILRSIFGKSKAAAIAGAILDTIAAVVKTSTAYPWPWSLIPMAAAAAAGFAQVQQIRSTDAGFAAGTVGMRYENFGAQTAAVLHGHEAVVTQAQGAGLAGDVMGAVAAGIASGGRSSGSMGDVHFANTVHINGANQSPEQIADAVVYALDRHSHRLNAVLDKRYR